MLTVNSVKEFLKPDWKNVLLTIIFLFLSAIISGGNIEQNELTDHTTRIYFESVSDEFSKWYGFPLKWLMIKYVWGYIDGTAVSLNLVTDLVFWYLISCLIISAWDKIKNKKQ